MDARQEKGRLLANDKRIQRIEGSTWKVPSQTQNAGGYLVNALAGTCSCPDHELRRTKCKHIWAVELTQTVETAADGSEVVTESIKVTRKTYRQDWPSFNAAQCSEKATVQVLLRNLCDGIVTQPHPGRGPKPIPLSDAVYGMTMKVYTTVSGRRATTDIKACAEAGHMARAPHYNSLFNYFEKPEMAPLLAAPMSLETLLRRARRTSLRRLRASRSDVSVRAVPWRRPAGDAARRGAPRHRCDREVGGRAPQPKPGQAIVGSPHRVGDPLGGDGKGQARQGLGAVNNEKPREVVGVNR